MTTLETPRTRSTAERWLWTAGGAAALGVVWWRDPNQSGSYGFCPLRALTGLDCPFCGGLRGTNALLHGDMSTALDHNVLLPLFLGIAVYGLWRIWLPAATTEREPGSARLLAGAPVALWWAIGAVTALFFVARNLPWFPYLGSTA